MAPLVRRAAPPPCTPVTALCRLARAIHHSARCPAVPLARRASRPSCAAPRIPRMPHRTALRAIRRPTHHPAPPVTAPRAKADDPAPPLPAQRGTSAHREQMFHVKHSGRKSFPRDIRNREAPPVPRIRTNETLPNGARGAATVAAAPLARRSLMQFASARRRETAPPLIRLHDMRNADRSAPRPQPPARERRGSQADDEPRAEPSQSEPYQTESSRTASGRIRPGRPNRSEPERFDRAEANRIRPNRTRASRTESDRSGPYRGKLDRSNRIGQTKANQAESSRARSNRAGSNLSEPNRAETDRIEPERAVSARTETHPLRLGLPDQVALKTTGQTHGTSVRARTMEHDRLQAILLHQMVEHVFERPSMQTETSRKLFGSVRLAALKRRANANHHANRLPRIRPFPPRSSARHRTSIHRQRSGLAQTPQPQTPECASCPRRAPNGPRASPHRRIV